VNHCILRALTLGSLLPLSPGVSSHCGPAPCCRHSQETEKRPPGFVNQAKTFLARCSLAKCAAASLKKSFLPPELTVSWGVDSTQRRFLACDRPVLGRYHQRSIPGLGEPKLGGCWRKAQPLGDGKSKRGPPWKAERRQLPVFLLRP